MLTDYTEGLFDRSIATAGPFGNAFDLGSVSIDLQASKNVGDGGWHAVFTVTTAFVDGGGSSPARVLFGIVTATDSALSANTLMMSMCGGSSPLLLGGTDLIATPGGFLAAALPLGTVVYVPVPLVTSTYRRRYLGLATIQPSWATGYFSAGSIRGRLEYNPKLYDAYPRVG